MFLFRLPLRKLPVQVGVSNCYQPVFGMITASSLLIIHVVITWLVLIAMLVNMAYPNVDQVLAQSIIIVPLPAQALNQDMCRCRWKVFAYLCVEC